VVDLSGTIILMHNDNGLDEGQILAEGSHPPPQSLAERIWENKWTWAVGRTWYQHTGNIGVYLALMKGLVAGQEPPAAILGRISAHWSPWQQENLR
jgi:hypothetical protein